MKKYALIIVAVFTMLPFTSGQGYLLGPDDIKKFLALGGSYMNTGDIIDFIARDVRLAGGDMRTITKMQEMAEKFRKTGWEKHQLGSEMWDAIKGGNLVVYYPETETFATMPPGKIDFFRFSKDLSKDVQIQQMIDEGNEMLCWGNQAREVLDMIPDQLQIPEENPKLLTAEMEQLNQTGIGLIVTATKMGSPIIAFLFALNTQKKMNEDLPKYLARRKKRDPLRMKLADIIVVPLHNVRIKDIPKLVASCIKVNNEKDYSTALRYLESINRGISAPEFKDLSKKQQQLMKIIQNTLYSQTTQHRAKQGRLAQMIPFQVTRSKSKEYWPNIEIPGARDYYNALVKISPTDPIDQSFEDIVEGSYNTKSSLAESFGIHVASLKTSISPPKVKQERKETKIYIFAKKVISLFTPKDAGASTLTDNDMHDPRKQYKLWEKRNSSPAKTPADKPGKEEKGEEFLKNAKLLLKDRKNFDAKILTCKALGIEDNKNPSKKNTPKSKLVKHKAPPPKKKNKAKWHRSVFIDPDTGCPEYGSWKYGVPGQMKKANIGFIMWGGKCTFKKTKNKTPTYDP